MLFPAALLLIAAHKSDPPRGDLALNVANPVIEVVIADVPMRLRVDLDQRESIDLNPAAAARLTVAWEEGMAMDVGRVRLRNRVALVLMRVQGRDVPTQVSEHGRDCCAGVDGAIGPDLLPFATIRWRNDAAPRASGTRSLPLDRSMSKGLSIPAEVPGIRLHFSFARAKTIGTAAAGGRLARLWGGHWSSEPFHAVIAYGITRPVRNLTFERPGLLGGFRIDPLIVRLSDFAGSERLPADPVEADEIVVTQHLRRQNVWPAVVIGNDRLSRCAEIVYTAQPRTLTLRCAFDRP